MKNLVIGFCLLGMLASCRDGKKKADPFAGLTEQIDSIHAETDSVPSITYAEEEEEIPVTADESFADFFYNFASDEAFQRSRTVFPLPLYEEKHVTRIEPFLTGNMTPYSAKKMPILSSSIRRKTWR